MGHPAHMPEDGLPTVSTVENVIDDSLVFNACFAGHGLVPLLPAGHHQANREFSILKLTPVSPVSRFGRGPHFHALANETEFRLPHPFPKRYANFGNERPKTSDGEEVTGVRRWE